MNLTFSFSLRLNISSCSGIVQADFPKWRADADALEVTFFGAPGDEVLIRFELLIDPAASSFRTWGERFDVDCFFLAKLRPLVRLGTFELIPKIIFSHKYNTSIEYFFISLGKLQYVVSLFHKRHINHLTFESECSFATFWMKFKFTN